MSAQVPAILAERVRAADRDTCCYCCTTVANSGMPLSFDHVEPRSLGGPTTFENVCQSCRPCNEFKSDTRHAEDPLTGERVKLFHPRRQSWRDHFAWSADASKIEGLTSTGRATVVALRLNRQALVAARRRWWMVGWHPPADETR